MWNLHSYCEGAFYLCKHYAIFNFIYFFKEINTFIQQEHIKLREKKSELWHKRVTFTIFFFFREEIKLRELQDGSQNSVKKSIVRKKLQWPF